MYLHLHLYHKSYFIFWTIHFLLYFRCWHIPPPPPDLPPTPLSKKYLSSAIIYPYSLGQLSLHSLHHFRKIFRQHLCQRISIANNNVSVFTSTTTLPSITRSFTTNHTDTLEFIMDIKKNYELEIPNLKKKEQICKSEIEVLKTEVDLLK